MVRASSGSRGGVLVQPRGSPSHAACSPPIGRISITTIASPPRPEPYHRFSVTVVTRGARACVLARLRRAHGGVLVAAWRRGTVAADRQDAALARPPPQHRVRVLPHDGPSPRKQ